MGPYTHHPYIVWVTHQKYGASDSNRPEGSHAASEVVFGGRCTSVHCVHRGVKVGPAGSGRSSRVCPGLSQV